MFVCHKLSASPLQHVEILRLFRQSCTFRLVLSSTPANMLLSDFTVSNFSIISSLSFKYSHPFQFHQGISITTEKPVIMGCVRSHTNNETGTFRDFPVHLDIPQHSSVCGLTPLTQPYLKVLKVMHQYKERFELTVWTSSAYLCAGPEYVMDASSTICYATYSKYPSPAHGAGEKA